MAIGKYTSIGGVIKEITGEYTQIDGVIKEITINAAGIDGSIKEISLGDRYFYTSESVNDELYRGTSEGAEDWHYDVADGTIVAVGADGVSYWGVGNDVIKLNADGTLAWTWTRYGVLITSICVESKVGYDYVYYGQIDGGVICIIDSPTPAEIWAVNVDITFTPPIYALAIDAANGYIYAGASLATLSKGVWRAALSTGTFVQIYASAENIISLAVDTNSPAGVYCGDSVGNYRKLGYNGHLYWTQTLTGSIVTIEIAHNGFMYLSCEAEKAVYKIDITGASPSEVWSYTPSPALASFIYQIAVDSSGNVYAVYRNISGASGNFIYKISKDGAYVWRWQSYVNVKFYGMAVTPGLEAAGM